MCFSLKLCFSSQLAYSVSFNVFNVKYVRSKWLSTSARCGAPPAQSDGMGSYSSPVPPPPFLENRWYTNQMCLIESVFPRETDLILRCLVCIKDNKRKHSLYIDPDSSVTHSCSSKSLSDRMDAWGRANTLMYALGHECASWYWITNYWPYYHFQYHLSSLGLELRKSLSQLTLGER